MKRVFAAALTAIMVLGLLGCGKLPAEGVVGATLKTNMAEITLTKFGFAEEGITVDPDNYADFCTPMAFPYELTGDETADNHTLKLSEPVYVRKTAEKCVPYLEFKVKLDSTMMLQKGVMPVLHFGEETYKCDAVSAEMLADDFGGQYDGVYYVQGTEDWNAIPLFWTQDVEYLCRAVLKLPAEVELDTGTPLTVTFALPQSDGTNAVLTYTIR